MVWCMVWFGLAWFGYGLVWFVMVLYSLVWFSMVWFGFGVMWCGLVQYGLVWYRVFKKNARILKWLYVDRNKCIYAHNLYQNNVLR